MRKRKLLVAFMAMLFMITSVIGNAAIVRADERSIAISGKEEEYILTPGETNHIQIPIIAVGAYLPMPKLGITIVSEGAPFTISNPTLTYLNRPASGINTTDPTYADFDVKVKDTAAIGTYKITLAVTYMDYLNNENITTKLDVNLKVIEEKAPAQLTVNNLFYKNSLVGTDTDLTFTIKNDGEVTAYNAYFSVDYSSSKTDISPRYTAANIKVGDLSSGKTKDITLPISILSTATVGSKTLTLKFTYKSADGTSYTETSDILINVKQNEITPKTPYLQFEDISYKGTLKPGKAFTLITSLRNDGDSKAENIKVSIDDSSIGKESFIKEYLTDDINASNMKKDSTQEIQLPLSVSKQATGGLLPLKVNVTYTDETGKSYTLSQTIYIDVVGEVISTDAPNILISNVKQSVAQPIAGDKVELSFDIENKSSVAASELKISATNLASNTFIPINAEPYIYIEKLAGGEKRTITIPLIVSETITEGLNNVAIAYTYAGDTSGGATFNIPVRNVVNDTGSSISKPKLIVSKYVTDLDQLRAGSTFNFIFDIYNTNSTVAAKNITITVTQADNVFSVTQGSNSFFINKIGPGETVQNSLEMKVKSDASTKTYPIEIAIEYEYDGAEPNPTTGEIGESKVEKLNLQAVENSRPVVDNVNVYSWDGAVTVGNNALCAFEFYNMGRSPLNNVIAYIGGDFTKADGEMYFIGNVTEGGSTYIEFDVVPNVEGQANGVLRITFEDSNGDTVEMTKEFTTNVSPVDVINPDMGGVDGGVDVFNPGPVAKKPILPIWLFVIIEVVIFIAFIPITRKIIISVYKARLLKKEEKQY